MSEDDIRFIPVTPNDYKGTGESAPVMPKVNYIPKPSGCNSTLDEVLLRCNPSNFMDPYDKAKVELANVLYSKALNLRSKGNAESSWVKQLRNQAIQQLGIVFSTEALYNELMGYCDPRLYTKQGANDAAMVSRDNELYALIIENATNIQTLEEVKEKARTFIQERNKEREEEKAREERRQRRIEEHRQKERERIEKEKEKVTNSCFSTFRLIIFILMMGMFGLLSINLILYKMGMPYPAPPIISLLITTPLAIWLELYIRKSERGE